MAEFIQITGAELSFSIFASFIIFAYSKMEKTIRVRAEIEPDILGNDLKPSMKNPLKTAKISKVIMVPIIILLSI